MENTENTIIQSNSINNDNINDNPKDCQIDLKEKLLKTNDTDSDNKISNDNKLFPEERKLKSISVISQSDSITQINCDTLDVPNDTQNSTKKQLKKSNSLLSQAVSIERSDCNTIKVNNENDSQDNSVEKNKETSYLNPPDSVSIVISNASEDNEEDEQKRKLLSINNSDSVSVDISNVTDVDRPNSVISDSDTVNMLTNTKRNSKKGIKKSNSVNSKGDKFSINKTKDTEVNPKKQKKQKSFVRKLLHLLIWIISMLLFILVCYIYFTIICRMNEKSDLENFDSKCLNKKEINDHFMNYGIMGEKNEKTIVILPRMGSPSPIIEYKPLAEALSSNYKVITIEPFGYGFSEDVKSNRTMENIVNELHQLIKTLNVNEYYLMGHSLGGLYSLEWAKDYTNEVLGFIGLDSSVPGIEKIESKEDFLTKKNNDKFINSLGFDRLKNILRPDLLPIDQSYKYTDDEIKIEKLLINNKSYTDAIVEDINNYYDNLSKLSGKKFPDKVPVLNFVSSESVEISDKWNNLQHEVLGNNAQNEVIVLNGPHNIHYKQKDAIVKKIKEWIK